MAEDNHVIGVFQDRIQADAALNALAEAGVPASKLSLLVSSEGRGHHFEVSDEKTKTAEGVAYGAVLGGLVAALAAATIPGSIFVAGPMAALFATGATGAAAGGLAGGLVGLGMAEDEAKLIEDDTARGSIVVAVHSVEDEVADRASDILEQTGATRVH